MIERDKWEFVGYDASRVRWLIKEAPLANPLEKWKREDT